MHRNPFGSYVQSSILGETVRAFVPQHFPPSRPWLSPRALKPLWTEPCFPSDDSTALRRPCQTWTCCFIHSFARRQCFPPRLRGPNPRWMNCWHMRSRRCREPPGDDVREVSRYVEAMNHGLERMAGGFPLSNRLLREMHSILLADGRGTQKQPGEFRRSQNWIGGTRPGNATFVPPPPTHLEACLTNLEQYLHAPANPVVKAALAHVGSQPFTRF